MPAPRRASLVIVVALASGCAIRVPAASAPSETTPRPTPTASPSLSAAEPRATPTATPSPTATPDPALLELEAFSCPGGVVLDWSPSTNADFHHYIALRSPEREIARNWPPLAPAVDWGDTYATDRFVTSAVDTSILPSSTLWHYRVMAYDVRGRAISASPVRTAQMRPQTELGELEAEAAEDGAVTLTWRPYAGPEHCFTAYRVVAGSGGGPLETLTVVSDQAAGTLATRALEPGVTYELRVEALRTTTLGVVVLGASDPLTFTAP